MMCICIKFYKSFSVEFLPGSKYIYTSLNYFGSGPKRGYDYHYVIDKNDENIYFNNLEFEIYFMSLEKNRDNKINQLLNVN